jgi:hypothetical protein
MNIKSKTYMQGSEFKERQGSFAFFCAKAFEFLVNFKNECAEGWRKLFNKAAGSFENRTLPLPFDKKITHKEWQEKATQVYLKLVNS